MAQAKGIERSEALGESGLRGLVDVKAGEQATEASPGTGISTATYVYPYVENAKHDCVRGPMVLSHAASHVLAISGQLPNSSFEALEPNLAKCRAHLAPRQLITPPGIPYGK